MKRILIPVLFALSFGAAAAEPTTPPPPPPPAAAPNKAITAPAAIGAPHICLQDYPAEAVALQQQGTTTIGFTITEAGTTTNIHVVNSSGTPALDDAAVGCASRWQYRPAAKDGKPVAVPWKAEVRWMLHGGESAVLAPTPVGSHDCFRFKPRGTKVPDGAVTTVRFRVTARGDVAAVEVVIPSGNDALDNAAMTCAAQWRFNPAKRDGQPVDVFFRANVGWSAP